MINNRGANSNKSIGILSLKGGVGKTSVTVSLGATIKEFEKKVLLVDGNLSAPNLGMHLNLVNPDTTIHHVLHGSANIRSSIHELDHFDLIPASIFFNKKVNPLKLKTKMRTLKKDYDVILIDSSPALNEETLAVMNASDQLFVVTTPDYPTLSATLKAVKNAQKRGVEINGIILNRVHGKSFELSIKDIEDTIEAPVLAVIPEDIHFSKSLSGFTPYTKHKPRSKGAEEYRKLASILIGEKYKSSKFKGFFKGPLRQEEVNREIFYESIFG